MRRVCKALYVLCNTYSDFGLSGFILKNDEVDVLIRGVSIAHSRSFIQLWYDAELTHLVQEATT